MATVQLNQLDLESPARALPTYDPESAANLDCDTAWDIEALYVFTTTGPQLKLEEPRLCGKLPPEE